MLHITAMLPHGTTMNPNDPKFSFIGTFQKAKDIYEYPILSMKIHWFNFLEGYPGYPDPDTPWTYSDGRLSFWFPLPRFILAMEKNMDDFDESITFDAKMITWWAKYSSVPEEEIANIKFAMGFVTGQYEKDTECVFGNDLGFRPDKGPNGEVAFANRYAIFYRNGDLHCGMFILTANIFESGPMPTPCKFLDSLPVIPSC